MSVRVNDQCLFITFGSVILILWFRIFNMSEVFIIKQDEGQIFKIQNLEALQNIDVEKKLVALWEFNS